MAVSMRERPVLRGKDAERFLQEERRVDAIRAQFLEKIDVAQPKVQKSQKTVQLCIK